jgi:hypothetical protein
MNKRSESVGTSRGLLIGIAAGSWLRPIWSAFTLAGVLCFAAVAVAQEEDAPADPLGEVRTLVAFTSDHDATIDAWINARIDELKAGVDQTPAEATEKFLEAFQAQIDHEGNTSEFQVRFAARAGEIMAAEFSREEPLPKELAWPMARVLHEINRIETRPALTVGLRHPVAAVRYLCARSFARLHRAIAADTVRTRDTIRILQEAGVAETDGVVLAGIYSALAFDEAEYVSDCAKAMAAVMTARAEKRQAGQIVLADRAEVIGFEYLNEKRSRLSEADKAALVPPLAAFLVLDTNRYAEARPDEKEVLAVRIELCESLLEAIAGSGGAVRAAMKKGGETVDLDMKLELLKWVGSDAEAGVLNEAPWNVPRGGLPAAP